MNRGVIMANGEEVVGGGCSSIPPLVEQANKYKYIVYLWLCLPYWRIVNQLHRTLETGDFFSRFVTIAQPVIMRKVSAVRWSR